MGALDGVFQRSVNGNGSVVGLAGPPGIGKSRIVRELTSRAKDAGAEVSATYCESHTAEVPFYAAAGLVRSTAGLDGLDDAAARAAGEDAFSGAEDEDLLLLDDLLGIGDPRRAAADRSRRSPPSNRSDGEGGGARADLSGRLRH